MKTPAAVAAIRSNTFGVPVWAKTPAARTAGSDLNDVAGHL
jgi:hypothetical protein